MKIRSGFVSNSSSSSFICCVCGETVTGMDLSLDEAGMIECVNGHTLCREELVEEYEGRGCGDDECGVEEKYCPVCNFLESSSKDMAAYLLKETKIPRDEAFSEVKKLNKRRKKLYDNEYVMYACKTKNIDAATLLPTVKERFQSYSAFAKYINGK